MIIDAFQLLGLGDAGAWPFFRLAAGGNAPAAGPPPKLFCMAGRVQGPKVFLLYFNTSILGLL